MTKLHDLISLALSKVLKVGENRRLPSHAELDLFCTYVDKLYLNTNSHLGEAPYLSYQDFGKRLLLEGNFLTAFDLIDFYSSVASSPKGLDLLASIINPRLCLSQPSSNKLHCLVVDSGKWSLQKSILFAIKVINKARFEFGWSLSAILSLLSSRNYSLYWSHKITIAQQIYLFIVSNRRLIPIPPYSSHERRSFQSRPPVNVNLRYKLYLELINAAINLSQALIISFLIPRCFLEGIYLDQAKYQKLQAPKCLILTQMALIWDLRLLAVIDKWKAANCQVLTVSHTPVNGNLFSKEWMFLFEEMYSDRYITNFPLSPKPSAVHSSLPLSKKTFNFNIASPSDAPPIWWSHLNRTESVIYFTTFFPAKSIDSLINLDSLEHIRFINYAQPLIMKKLSLIFGSSLLVRPHPWERKFHGHNDIMNCAKIAKNLGIAVSTAPLACDLRANIIIFDNFSSAIFDALKFETPFVLVFPEALYENANQDQKYVISALEDAGLAFRNIKCLFEFLSTDYKTHVASKAAVLAYANLRNIFCKPAMNHAEMIISLWQQSSAIN